MLGNNHLENDFIFFQWAHPGGEESAGELSPDPVGDPVVFQQEHVVHGQERGLGHGSKVPCYEIFGVLKQICRQSYGAILQNKNN